MEGHRGLVWALALSPDGRKVLSAGDTIILWDAETRMEVRRLRGHPTGWVGCVAFLPNGRSAVSSGWDGTIRLWDLETGEELHCFRGQANGSTWVSVSPDGRRLLSSNWGGRDLRLLDVESRKELHRVDLGTVNPIRGCFTPDGLNAIWAGSAGDVRVYHLTEASGTWLASLPEATWLAAALLAVLFLMILVFAVRRHSWGPFESSKRPVAAGASATTVHPDAAILELFAAGRLRSSEMDRIGEHLEECWQCLDVLERLPEDPMLKILRAHAARIDRSPPEPGAEVNRGDKPGGLNGIVVHRTEEPGDSTSMSPSAPVEMDDGERPTPGGRSHPRFELKTPLGRGGMGFIHLAHDRQENRNVVLKFIREEFLDNPGLVERFSREALAATRLKHPNIVEAYGLERFGRWSALVMEFIDGTNLARLVAKKGPLPLAVACELIRQAAIGLQYSFEQGMVHRDIKPSNLMVTGGGKVKILDFGLAKMHSELFTDAGQTSTGAFLGSVEYMSPEQAEDPRLADIRSDIYSLGCTFYYLLSGGPPFHGSTIEVLEAHHSREAPFLSKVRPEISDGLSALVARMTKKAPVRRFQTPGVVAQALTSFLDSTDGASASAVAHLSHAGPDPRYFARAGR
jgi:hypothetical protein